jgi:hypothetical protein
MNDQMVSNARMAVHRDLEDLGRELWREQTKVRDHGIALAGSLAALGFLVGMGGARAVKRVLAIGAVAAAAFAIAKKRGYITAPGASS